MALEPLAGFQHFETHHCVTGSFRHVYAFNGHDLSEDLLLGLDGGVGFSYWHFKGQPPFFGGRRVSRELAFGVLAGRRTGVVVADHYTSSARKAERALLDMLQSGQPVVLQVDMGFLPYFDFGGTDYHFGGHVIVVCGYDPEMRQVLIADREADLHPVSLEALARARGSTHKPFPPRHCWFTFDFSGKRLPTPDEVRAAIREQAHDMLHPPIRNIGVAGIRKAGEEVVRWPKRMDRHGLKWALFNAYIFITPVGGTGGGAFRYMFSRFLGEAADLTGDARLKSSADEFWGIADGWEAKGQWFKELSELDDPAPLLDDELRAWFAAQADCEQAAWERLLGMVG